LDLKNKLSLSFQKYPIIYLLLIFIIFFSFLFYTKLFLYVPKIILLIFIIAITYFLGNHQEFFKDWFVFLAFIYMTDTLRGLIYYAVCKFQLPVYCEYVIKLEKFLFGKIPSVFLQQKLLSENTTTWMEEFLTLLHGTHFIAFLFVGFVIWIKNKSLFKNYKTSFYILLSGGMLSYFLVPTVPPWMAANFFEILPRIIHFNIDIYNMFVPDLSTGFNTNPIGAMPSLHAAFPALCSFLLWKQYKWKAFPFYIYASAVFFTIIYTGDHYIVDVIAGIILAAVSFFISVLFSKKQFHSQKYSLKMSAGIFIFIFSITGGLSIKPTLTKIYNLENIHIPRYVDFIKDAEKYTNNFSVNFYLADHYFFHNKYEDSIYFFLKAREASENFMERKKAEQKIKECRKFLNIKRDKNT